MTFQLNGTETCTGHDRCHRHRLVLHHARRAGGDLHRDRTFTGDSTVPLQLNPSNGSASFIVTLNQTTLTYTGGTVGTERAAADRVGRAHERQQHPVERPAGHVHPGQRDDGTDLRRRDDSDRGGLLRHQS